MTDITYEEWEAKYKPLPMLETYGADFDVVCETDPKYVWTWVDGGDYSGYTAGVHIVNRMGYFVCQEPWEDEDLYVDIYEPYECEAVGHEFEQHERYDGKLINICKYCEMDEVDLEDND